MPAKWPELISRYSAPGICRAIGSIADGGRSRSCVQPITSVGQAMRGSSSVTFESAKAKAVHLVGDAIMPGDMPKSGFAANVQGKACAHALAALLRGAPPPEPMLINTCYSLASETWGFSIAGVYKPLDGALRLVKGSGGISPVDADPSVRGLEAQYERSWFDTLTSELWG